MTRQAIATHGGSASATAGEDEAARRNSGVRKNTPRPKPSKSQQLIRLLSAKAGADAATIGRKLGWQPHTVRAALSGLRKVGYEVEGERPGEGRAVRYRILAVPVSGIVAGNVGENA